MTALPSATPLAAANPSQGLIAALGRAAFPLELDRVTLAGAEGAPLVRLPAKFRFCFGEVPFKAHAERRDGKLLVALEGELGTMPFTFESATRRRRLGRVLAAAQRHSGFRWGIDGRHCIAVRGETLLEMPVTPTAVLTGAAALLIRLRPYLDLMVEVGGEA